MHYLLKILADFFQEYKITTLVYFIILFIYQPLYVIGIPKLFSIFFDKLSLHKNSSYETLKPIIIKYTTYISITMIITFILGSATNYLEDKIIPNFIGYLNTFMFTNLLKQRENNFSEIDISKIYMYLVDVPNDVLLLLKDVVTIIPSIAMLISMVVYSTYLNVGLGLITLSLYVIILYLSSLAIPICLPLAKEKQKSIQEKLVKMNDKLSNLTNIFSSGYMKEEIDDFENIVDETKKKIMGSNYCATNNSSLIKFLYVLSVIIIISYGGYLCMNKKISTTDLASLVIIISKITVISNSISYCLSNITYLTSSIDFHEPTTQSLYETYEMDKNSEKTHISLENGNIKIHSLNFKHKDTTKYIIENLFLEIPAGQKVAIMGNSGCGKSTLVKLLMGYYPVPNDTIFIDDKCINSHRLSNLRKQITFINQNTRLFNDTVLKNIQYGNNMTREDIMGHIDRTGTYSIFETLTDGLETPCGINGELLSGGQKQLVQFLKNIERNNKIIILDEPTAAVDAKNTQNIVQAIEEIAKNSTLIVVTHDKNVTSIMDRVITMNNGKIVNDVYTKKNNSS
jgi:ABC-type bacteriocin/lantibiotic exporter with double-glycine peptidase domain